VHTLTVTVFALLGGVLVVLDLLGRRSGSRIPTARELLTSAMRSRPTVVLITLVWWWAGWHFLVSGG
jgi:hypothetical protein